jgi:hypothetical protein
VTKVYEVGLPEPERLEAVQILTDHHIPPDDVYRLEVDDDTITVYRYQTPRQLTHFGGQVAVRPPLMIPR